MRYYGIYCSSSVIGYLEKALEISAAVIFLVGQKKHYLQFSSALDNYASSQTPFCVKIT